MYLFDLDGEAQAVGDTSREQENPLCIDAVRLQRAPARGF
jgi:hypothetical protein